MKIRLADFVSKFMVKKGISNCFMVTGGGAMYLNDALGHQKGLHCTFNHHEQACAMAAEGYAKLNNKPALLCITTGPGGTNSLTGVLGSYLDSIPMLIVSGQVRYDATTTYNEKYTNGYKLRSVGDQEFNIISVANKVCKYATLLEDPYDILYALEKAYFLATTGRKGPCWIDIPLDFQATIIDTKKLKSFKPNKSDLPKPISNKTINEVISLIKNAKRPVFYAGTAIRTTNGVSLFKKLINKLNIPICTYWNSIDLISTNHPLYCGRAGTMGDRSGNFAIQNADVILAVGNRLSIREVGYNHETWARKAKVIMVDIDKAELLKPTIHVELPIWADAYDFLTKLDKAINKAPVFKDQNWLNTCHNWKIKYPVLKKEHLEENKYVNPYFAFNYISNKLPYNAITVSDVGTCCVVGHQSWIIKEKTRFIHNNGCASMGYGLPAAIGACLANNKKGILCLEGDGGIMMNLQELQTIITNKLPIKIILINNNGYQSIRLSQKRFFGNKKKIGIGPDSNDLSFPSFKKISKAFDIPYYKANTNKELIKTIDKFLNEDAYALLELFVTTNQNFEPKSEAKILKDGTIISAPLEDLAPYLTYEELKENMFIDLIDEKKK